MKIAKKLMLVVIFTLLFCMSIVFTACEEDLGDATDDIGGGNSNENEGGNGDNGNSEEEFVLPKEEGYNQITFYWSYPGVIENCDVWVWWDGKEGSGYLLHPCKYGAKAMINVPVGIDTVGFIIRRDCSEPGGNAWGTATKDFAEDRQATLIGEDTVIYLKSGDGFQYTSTDGGENLTIIKMFRIAGITAFDTIRYSLTPKTKITSLDMVKLYEGDREIEITDLSSLDNEVDNGVITVSEKLDVTKNYRLSIEGYGEKEVVPTDIFDSEEFIEEYVYTGDDLGATIDGTSTTFRVWAPTASKVVLNLFNAGNGGEAYANREMVKGEKGVWEYTEANCGHGKYYTYSVTTSVGTQEAVDPYAKSAGVNGDRGMVIDLDSTDPTDWESEEYISTSKYTDATIWEVHVRDFSNKIASSQYKGKYLAFTERGLTNSSGVSVGVDYLINLGISHVHLLPVYDYATVDETNPNEQFNWGYDPKNYNVPEGSYSTDPYNGEVRVNEYKRMVQSLHDANLGVIMDVVYNHTYDANSSFNKIVPYYYYRYTATGANSSASGCGNDTASERAMYGKFMVDSVKYWVSEYKLDGLRFDLMGLHDLETMKKIEQAVHEINPSAIIYGEGWTMGSTIDGSAQANQGNISKIEKTKGAAGSVAVFNDVIRDGLKGSTFNHTAKGYISGSYDSTRESVKFGIRGGTGAGGAGWSVKSGAVINYVSAHDNHTLWDKLAISNADNTEEERIAMNKLGFAIVILSKGTPFMQAGEEMLRTKGGDENSYKSSDEVNNIDWESLTLDSNQYATMQYYKGLIALRNANYVLRANDGVAITFTNLDNGGMVVSYTDNRTNSKMLAIINPSEESLSYELNGEWKLLADGNTAGSEVIRTDSGAITIGARSVLIYKK